MILILRNSKHTQKIWHNLTYYKYDMACCVLLLKPNQPTGFNSQLLRQQRVSIDRLCTAGMCLQPIDAVDR